jgi:hypothetical protein
MCLKMTEASSLMDKYKQLTTSPLNSSNMTDEGDSISVLCQTNWIRIVLVRKSDEPNVVTIEVESSLPKCAGVYSSPKTNSSSTELLEMDDSELLSGMITHLQYMQRLHELGFDLEIIGPDCLWTAYSEFESMPSRKTFEVLVPPL